MKISIRHIITLLIVFSATLVYAVDSAYMATNCRIVAQEETLYRLEFVAAKDQDVTIRLYDKQNELVYQDRVVTSSFVKAYDLSNLPKGSYTFEVHSEGFDFEKDIVLEEAFATFRIDQREGRKVSLIGSNQADSGVSLYITDQTGQTVYYEADYNKKTQINKIFNFEKLKDDQVKFYLYQNNQLVSQQEVKFQ